MTTFIAQKCACARTYPAKGPGNTIVQRVTGKQQCPKCQGAGKVITCSVCQGAGMHHNQRCEVCRATGWMPVR